jgi:hypothetical protein
MPDAAPTPAPLTEADLDACIRAAREAWYEHPEALASAMDTRLEPWRVPGVDAPATACSGHCRGLRRPCDCPAQRRPLLWADLPERWRVRLVAGALLIAVLATALAAAFIPHSHP